MALSEFAIIRRYFDRMVAPDADHGVILGIGDDAALLRIPANRELALSIDTLVAGVHFPLSTDPFDIGYKALAVNLSDMAAMGAEPRWATLALTLPQPDTAWLERFSAGFFELAERHKVQLIGGDTTRGPLSITVQIQGLIPVGQALRRGHALPGDLIYVTGALGDAGLALRMLRGDIQLPSASPARVLERLNRPTPRIAEGMMLRNLAHAAIDISDGLVADLGHILEASAVGATLFLEKLPLSTDVATVFNDDWDLPLCAGDDYELCFTAPESAHATLMKRWEDVPSTCTVIGVIDEASGLRLKLPGGKLHTPRAVGYRHF